MEPERYPGDGRRILLPPRLARGYSTPQPQQQQQRFEYRAAIHSISISISISITLHSCIASYRIASAACLAAYADAYTYGVVCGTALTIMNYAMFNVQTQIRIRRSRIQTRSLTRRARASARRRCRPRSLCQDDLRVVRCWSRGLDMYTARCNRDGERARRV